MNPYEPDYELTAFVSMSKDLAGQIKRTEMLRPKRRYKRKSEV